MFHSDLPAVNAQAFRLGALLGNSLTECARSYVAKVSAETYLTRAEQVANGFDDLVLVVRFVTDRLNEFEQRHFGGLR
jgi:hypothetical protein